MRYLLYPFIPFFSFATFSSNVTLLIFPRYRKLMLIERELNKSKAPFIEYLLENAIQHSRWLCFNAPLKVINILLASCIVSLVFCTVFFLTQLWDSPSMALVGGLIFIVPIYYLVVTFQAGRPSNITKQLAEYQRMSNAKKAIGSR